MMMAYIHYCVRWNQSSMTGLLLKCLTTLTTSTPSFIDEETSKLTSRHVEKRFCLCKAQMETNSILTDLFWHRWTLEYLPLLQEYQRWSRLKRNVEIEDIVLVVDSSAPRNSWMMGRIIKTMPDSKGNVCSVCVQMKSSTLNRLISKICLLQEAV